MNINANEPPSDHKSYKVNKWNSVKYKLLYPLMNKCDLPQCI